MAPPDLVAAMLRPKLKFIYLIYTRIFPDTHVTDLKLPKTISVTTIASLFKTLPKSVVVDTDEESNALIA